MTNKSFIINKLSLIVTTLALGLRPKQGLARLLAKREARESRRMFPGVYENVR
jgi:hypothetical protein